ncbi:MAG: histidinol dehydrogenase [Endomicrobium sp.]|jgi:histidinol dehydrogenase|nr:histidinol dehydrogenase [Endomicrobium sp.]
MDKKQIRNYTADIIEDVRKNGDKAVLKYLKRFDGVDLSKSGYRVSQKEIDAASENVSPEFKRAIKTSYANVLAFHKRELSQIKKSWKYVKNSVITGQFYTPVSSAGLYIPGGRFPYPSTVIMTAVAAKAAGVERIVIVSPPKNITAEVLYAAKICAVKEIYKVGGIAAIAALAYGSETIEKVNIIAGPGNMYVNEAKRQVFGDVGIDSLAGPSEVAIIADRDVPEKYAAADIMAQVEHDPMARAYLFCECKTKIAKIKALLPKEALKQVVIERCSLNKAVEKTNALAPEHLELLVKDYAKLVKDVKNAGAVFAGWQTPTAAGDYWAGPSHVLPTNASAKFASGLSAATFLKRTSYIELNKKNKKAYKEIAALAQAEGMAYHKKSAVERSVL